jgi:hypothetical protein
MAASAEAWFRELLQKLHATIVFRRFRLPAEPAAAPKKPIAGFPIYIRLTDGTAC